MHIPLHSISEFITVALLVILTLDIVVAEGETKIECDTNGVKDEKLFIMSIHTTSSDEEPPSWILNNINTESVVASSLDDGMQARGLVQMCLPLDTCYELSFESKSWGWFKAIYSQEIVIEAAQGLDQRLAAKFGSCEMDVPTGSSSGNCNKKFDPVFCGQDDKMFSNQCVATTTNTEFTDLTCCPYHPGCDEEDYHDPVTCNRVDQKGRECKYTNECKAKAAAFDQDWICRKDEKDGAGSVPETCPTKIGICNKMYNPVECYLDEHTSCEYNNQCMADKNGFTELQCCPLNKGVCPAVFDPVVCSRVDTMGGRECKYSNKCRASALDENWICKKDEENNTGSKPSSCPNESGICFAVYDPVKCYFPDGTFCKYSNQCFANNNNFNKLDCCPVKDECTEEYDPVVCYRNNQPGSRKCEYSNKCEASSTDSNWTCEKDISVQVESDTCPSPSPGICSKISRPVDCRVDGTATSSTTCRYENICLAKRASDSFNEKTCCPVVTNTGKCTSTKQAPVRCGGCEYNNICEANSVGYSRKMCTNLNGCPLPKNPGRCINAKKMPVFGIMRGNKKCWYASKCLAKKAGFRKKNIQKIKK